MAEAPMDRASAAEVLGVPADAGREEVVAAYRRYVRTHHPDSAADHWCRYGADTSAGADLVRAASARECLLGRPNPSVGPEETVRSDRQRTFHQSPSWWRRLIIWRKP